MTIVFLLFAMSGGKCGEEMCFRHAERLSENSVRLLFEDTSVVSSHCCFLVCLHVFLSLYSKLCSAFTDFGSS